MTLNELIAAVPVHDYKGRAYFVVLDEIPQPWAEQFMDALYGSACPVIDGFGPCAYAWDWDLWVRGGWRGGSHGPQLPQSLIHDILQSIEEVKAGQLAPYKFGKSEP